MCLPPLLAGLLSLRRLDLSFLSLLRLLRRIPHGARESLANKLATILDDIVAENSEASWNCLFLFPSRCLRSPARGGHRRSLASQVNEAIRRECDDYLPSPNINRLHPNPLKNLGSRVAAKLEEGNFKGAVRIASSVESFAPNNAETLSALRSKHPAPHPNSLMPPPFPPDQLQGLQVSCEEVVGAIKSFPCGSAGGPDGLRPQHLKDMVCSSAGGGVSCLLRALTAFINLVLKGKDCSLCLSLLLWGFSHCLGEDWWRSETNCSGMHTSSFGSQMCGKPNHGGHGCTPCPFSTWIWYSTWS